MLEGSQGTDAYARARCALDRLYISSDAAPSCSCSCGGSQWRVSGTVGARDAVSRVGQPRVCRAHGMVRVWC